MHDNVDWLAGMALEIAKARQAQEGPSAEDVHRDRAR